MRVWWHMCSEEVLGILSRSGMYLAAVFLAGLSIAAMLQSRGDLQEHRARHNEELQDRVQAQFRTQAPNGRTVDSSLRVLRPPVAAAILVPTSAATLPSGWDVGPAGVEARPPYPVQGGGLGTAVSLGIDGIVLVFGGLLSAALGFYQILSARSSNWSSALKALPVAWHSIVGAHLAASAVLIALGLSLWWIIVEVLVALIEPDAAPELRWTLLRLIVPTYLYLVTLNWAGIGVALWSPPSLQGVVMGLALWVAVTFVVPQALWLVARTALPQESRHAMERARQEGFADEIKQFEDSIGRTIGAHAPTLRALSDLENIDDPPIQHLRLDEVWRAGIAKARGVAQAFDVEWQVSQVQQRRVLNTRMALSPATALAAGVSELAGVGETAGEAWETAVRRHHAALTKVLFDDRPMLNSMVPVGRSFTSFALIRHPPRSHKEFPPFQEPSQEWWKAWRGAARPLGWLVFHVVLALTWAYGAGRRDARRDV
jgi:hypothetical protein